VRTPADGRGGSTPPRPSATAKPQQWFTLRPWLFDVTAATWLLRAAPARPSRWPSSRGHAPTGCFPPLATARTRSP